MELLTKDQREEKKIIKQLKKGEYYQINEYLFLLEKTGGEVSYINEFISALFESRWEHRLIDVAKRLFRINYEKFYEQIDALLSRELYSRNHFLGGSWIEIVVNHEFSEKYLPELEEFSLCEGYAICFMKQYKDYICCEDVFKRVISWIENIEGYVPSWEEEDQYALQNLNKKNNRVKYALTCFKQANVVDDQTFETVILENGSAKTILSYLKMDPTKVIDWIKAEDRLCELHDIPSLIEFVKLYPKCNQVYIASIVKQYGTISDMIDFMDVSTEEALVQKLTEFVSQKGTEEERIRFTEKYVKSKKREKELLKIYIGAQDVDRILSSWKKEERSSSSHNIFDYLLNQHVIRLKDVRDLLLVTNNQEHQILLKDVEKRIQSYSSTNLSEKIDQMALDWNYVTDFDSNLLSPEEQLWLVNLSLTRKNVLPSAVKNIEEVKENLELYLDLLKKCDERKYKYYIEAFRGNISFAEATSAYQYYLENQEELKSEAYEEELLEKLLSHLNSKTKRFTK